MLSIVPGYVFSVGFTHDGLDVKLDDAESKAPVNIYSIQGFREVNGFPN